MKKSKGWAKGLNWFKSSSSKKRVYGKDVKARGIMKIYGSSVFRYRGGGEDYHY